MSHNKQHTKFKNLKLSLNEACFLRGMLLLSRLEDSRVQSLLEKTETLIADLKEEIDGSPGRRERC